MSPLPRMTGGESYSIGSTTQGVLRDDDANAFARHRGPHESRSFAAAGRAPPPLDEEPLMSALALSVLLSFVSAVAYAGGAIVQERVAVTSPGRTYAPLRRPGWWAARYISAVLPPASTPPAAAAAQGSCRPG